jgi:hypothetical protein
MFKRLAFVATVLGLIGVIGTSSPARDQPGCCDTDNGYCGGCTKENGVCCKIDFYFNACITGSDVCLREPFVYCEGTVSVGAMTCNVLNRCEDGVPSETLCYGSEIEDICGNPAISCTPPPTGS